MRINARLHISRNMAIVRHAGELTLVNPIRLRATEEDELRRLGVVKRILRLGAFHGLDDPYYVATFQAEFWCQPDSTIYPVPKADQTLTLAEEFPVPDAKVFCFQGTLQPEAALLLERAGGVLLTCDAIQHYGDYRHHNLPARLLMPLIGFSRTTIVGPFWLKRVTPVGNSLEGEFRRLLAHDFDHLVSAHGSALRGGAHAAVTAAVNRAFCR